MPIRRKLRQKKIRLPDRIRSGDLSKYGRNSVVGEFALQVFARFREIEFVDLGIRDAQRRKG